jgi:hypothetical protein
LQVECTPNGGGDRAEVGVAAASQTNDFAPHTILLGGEFQGNKYGGAKMVRGGGGRVKRKGTKKETDILKLKWLGVGYGAGVFAGAQEKIEHQANHIGAGEFERGVGKDGLSHDVLQDWDGQWFDTVGGFVSFRKT